MKLFAYLYLIIISASLQAQDTSRVSLLFIGDVMGHDRQLEAAYNAQTGEYNFDTCFYYVSPIFKQHDFAIANLEVTLNCKPYSGYPAFSSPAELPKAIVKAGVNVFVTANNHSADRAYKGVVNTNNELDKIGVKHTGTFNSQEDRNKKYPLLLEKNGIRLGLLNYTYGLNGIPVPAGTIINLIDTAQIRQDLVLAKTQKYDKIIVFIHWGIEYQMQPNAEQIQIANFIFKQGADIIIGSHPHVVQKSVYQKATDTSKETFIVYSLGNFISNQRTQPRDGGQMIHLEICKVGSECFIQNQGNILTWVYAPLLEGEKDFLVLPAAQFESKPEFFVQPGAFNKMQSCLQQNRAVLDVENVGVKEIK